MKRNIKPFYVITWDFNNNKIESFDIMSYLVARYKELRKADKPKDEEGFKKFIKSNAMYQWWSRCEYEIIIKSWPKQDKEIKLDVYAQVMMNIDVITKLFVENVL